MHTPDTVEPVPNKPRTPITGVRIPLDLKTAATKRAHDEGTNLSAVIREHLERYVKEKP